MSSGISRSRTPAAVQARSLGHQEQADRFFRLKPDNQLVRPRRRAARGEDRIRYVLELDEDLGVALRHALAGAQVEGHALPPPIVDVGLQGDEGLGVAVMADLVGIAGHGSPSIAPRAYWPMTRRALDVVRL